MVQYITHGLAACKGGGAHTPVAPVRALEAWNASSGHFPIEFYCYAGSHAGTDAAKAELSQVLTAIVSIR